jgi:hypothetical protein
MDNTGRPRGFHLLDLSAIVVGYGMASLLVRAFWPTGGRPPLAEMMAIGLVYLWLGLAMSGPLVLLVRRPAGPAGAGQVESMRAFKHPGGGKRGRVGQPGEAHPPMIAGSRTWAELAWLIIGFYWIGLTVLVVPVRLHRSPLHDSALIGLLPVAAALLLRLLDRPSRSSRPNPAAPAWTHHAAVGLLLAWPPAWIALILLVKSLL